MFLYLKKGVLVNNMKRLLLLLILIANILSPALHGAVPDSILRIINSMPADTTRLVYICQQIKLGRPTAQSLDYTALLLKEANKQKNLSYAGMAMFTNMRYYYTVDADSLYYWLEKAEPVFRKAGMIEELFRSKAWYIYAMTREGKGDKALDLVKQLRVLSDELKYPDGREMANQAQADFYIKNSLKKEGLLLYEEVLKGMEERNAPLVKRVHIIRNLLNMDTADNKRVMYLKLLRGYIDDCKKAGIKELDSQNTIPYLEYLYYRSYLLIYISRGNYPEAKDCLEKIKEIEGENKGLVLTSTFYELSAHYYNGIGDYKRALQLYDCLIIERKQSNQLKALIDVIQKRGDILYKMERYQDAADCFYNMIQMNDSLTRVTYYKDLADMRAQHENDKLQIQNKQMELESVHARSQMLMMGGGLALLALICCLLGFISYSRHRYGKQLELAKEKAEESERMKSAFLANMNHEIRTPLNAIVGFSQVIVEEEEQEVRREYAGIIQSNNELLQRLITDVLDISKIESNAMSLHYAEYDLAVFMKEIYSMILLRMPPGVILELTNCPERMFYTDRNRLTQILTNLLTNAIKHTEKGTICFGCEQKGNDLLFFVEDTGKGIPEEQLENIFSRFVQLSDWTKGVGLGLAICKGLIVKMGGEISVTSQIGVGSRFVVKLPSNV